jgi:hypothetical protein
MGPASSGWNDIVCQPPLVQAPPLGASSTTVATMPMPSSLPCSLLCLLHAACRCQSVTPPAAAAPSPQHHAGPHRPQEVPQGAAAAQGRPQPGAPAGRQRVHHQERLRQRERGGGARAVQHGMKCAASSAVAWLCCRGGRTPITACPQLVLACINSCVGCPGLTASLPPVLPPQGEEAETTRVQLAQDLGKGNAAERQSRVKLHEVGACEAGWPGGHPTAGPEPTGMTELLQGGLPQCAACSCWRHMCQPEGPLVSAAYTPAADPHACSTCIHLAT